MTPICDEVQERLADGGVAAVRGHPEHAGHLADCDACATVLFGLVSLDRALLAGGDYDVPPALDASVLARVRADADDVELDFDEVAAQLDGPEDDQAPFPEPEPEPELEPELEPPRRLARVRGLAGRAWRGAARRPRLRWVAAASVLLAGVTVVSLVSLVFVGERTAVLPFIYTFDGGGPDAEQDGVAEFELSAGERADDREGLQWLATPAEPAPPPAASAPVTGMRQPQDLSGKSFDDIFRPQVRKKIQARRNRGDSLSINTPSGGGRRGRASTTSDSRVRASRRPAAPAPAQDLPAAAYDGDRAQPEPEPATAALARDEVQRRGLLGIVGTSGGDVVDLLADGSDGVAHGNSDKQGFYEAKRRLLKTEEEDRTVADGSRLDEGERPRDANQPTDARPAVQEGANGLVDPSAAAKEGRKGLSELLAAQYPAGEVFDSGWGGKDGNAGVEVTASSQFGSNVRGQTLSGGLGGQGSRPGFSRGAAGADELDGRFEAALAWFAEHARRDGLRFRAARGYWKNTYLPGRPAIRQLQQALQSSPHAPGTGDLLALAEGALRVNQPFDAPRDEALAVYLSADAAAAPGPTRMRLQVGLQGSERGAGRRPAMNVGVVLDLRRKLTESEGHRLRALLLSLADARDLSDRIGLYVAGPAGGEIIAPGDFRYGTVEVALRELLAPREGREPTLAQTFDAAHRAVSAGDDPTAPLGSSLLLVVSPAADAPGLARRARGAAVDGVPVSTVAIGDAASLAALDEVALAGQGHSRRLREPSEADDLVDAELSAASRVIARAVRLRIRLAPGVKLVNVLGSERLDVVQSQRVRQAERSIDQRLSRNLGIAQDRGDDEEGIQIVVPAWYAGDSHTILLDVVVPEGGRVADVTVRYKDLVQLRNGVARASLELPQGPRDTGPLQTNVLRNHLAFEVADGLRTAGEALAAGEIADARLAVTGLQALLAGVARVRPELATDTVLAADRALVAEYLRLLQAGPTGSARESVARSLKYAGELKTLPPPRTP